MLFIIMIYGILIIVSCLIYMYTVLAPGQQTGGGNIPPHVLSARISPLLPGFPPFKPNFPTTTSELSPLIYFLNRTP